MKSRTRLAALLSILALGRATMALAAPIDIPLRTWVARPIPGNGSSPCAGGSCKHMRLAHSSDNGRIYFEGGDYSGALCGGSGCTELWSYSIQDDNWILETPYCVPPGEVQPAGPDEVGWAYDPARHQFWMVPGYQWAANPSCTGTQVHGQTMTFDPAARRWAALSAPPYTSGTGIFFAQFDSTTGTLIGFGQRTWIYNTRTDSWTSEAFPFPEALDFSHMYTAFDRATRRIYLIEPKYARIYRYDIDSHQMTYLGPTPTGSSYESYPFWDSVNHVVLWNMMLSGDAAQLAHLYIYHPDTNTWEQDPMLQPAGLAVQGRSGVYDPVQNVLMIMGINGTAPEPYLFLYRYGNGSGGPPPPPDITPPSAPANLRPR